MSALPTPRSFHNGRVVLYAGDCLAVLDALPENSVAAVVSDPPYHLASIVKRFGASSASPAKDYSGEKQGATGAYARASRGFMGKEWDGGDIAFRAETWAKVLRVLKPGGHLVAFSAPKCSHRMVCAIEDAGFEIRDALQWMFGTGFPKSHDVSKAIDKALGVERKKVRVPIDQVRNPKSIQGGHGIDGGDRPWMAAARESGFHEAVSDEAVSDEAVFWEGWGTALKPAFEPICLARKPLSEKNVAANVLRWGTGAINIDACRVEFAGTNDAAAAAAAAAAAVGFAASRARGTAKQSQSIGKESRDGVNRYNPFEIAGRWPANICHDGSDDVVGAFPQSDGQRASVGPQHGRKQSINCYGDYGPRELTDPRGDSGSAARFFYSAKADATDRAFSKHPTVKPVDLMRWLVRLVTPPGGTVLDPFAGTGTTGHAALLEGFDAILIEREAEYQADIERRMALVFAGEIERASHAPKKEASDLPLFGEARQ